MLGTRIKWGILGTSYISEVMAHAIQESCTGQLVAIGSRSLATAKKFSDKFLIPKCYDNYQLLIDDNEIDVIYIGLPNHFHKEWIIRSAQAGKHILCEKPLVIDAAEALQVIPIISKYNVFCMEALMYRYHPFIKKLHSLVQENIIGNIRLYNATYTSNIAERANPVAGGSIRNLGCYPLSLVRLLANAEPTAIQAMGKINPKNKMDNQASVMLKFEDNSMAVISTADDIEKSWQFDLYGTNGYLKAVTNPWKPDRTNNKIIIYQNDTKTSHEINVTAEKSLYTYQVDTLGSNIISRNFSNNAGMLDSLGNITVLETWLKKIASE